MLDNGFENVLVRVFVKASGCRISMTLIDPFLSIIIAPKTASSVPEPEAAACLSPG
jgi:hypothetical protein